MGRESRRNAQRHEGGTVDDKWWRIIGSDGRARSSRSVPASDGRVLHRELLGGRNTASKLMCRQLRDRMPPRLDVNFCNEKFRRFKLQEQFFVHSGIEHPLGTTTSVAGITAANDFISVVASSGVCMAFRHTNNGSIAPYRRDRQIWYFNNVDERIELVFYNKINDSIIIVSSRRHGNGYKTRALPLESIRRCNQSDNGVQIFGVNSIGIPIFCGDNNIAVVRHNRSVNNVHEMNNYNLVHSFGSKKILFARPRPGVLIVAYTWTETYLPIEVLSTENWVVLKQINYVVPPCGIGIVWICQDNILLTEKGKKEIHMINISNDDSVNLIRQTNKHQDRPLAIYDLTAKRLLLRFNKSFVVASCSSHDEQVALLEDNEVPVNYNDNRYSDSDIYVTRDKNYAMVYSRKYVETKPRQGFSCIGSINICNTFNGESVWKMNPCDDVDLAIATQMEGGNKMTNIRSIIHEALQDVTTLFYDEERHRIYTGNKRGFFMCGRTKIEPYVVHEHLSLLLSACQMLP